RIGAAVPSLWVSWSFVLGTDATERGVKGGLTFC
ncbi:MAG: hypothetical protein QOF73_514, partial [Thermomicrobiales bacterium]|nr:hypothetical protein [Thermomicrobiales bacterium]